MPKHVSPPKYTKHKASGQAVVRINGRDYYLGPHGSKVSVAEYDRLIAEWLANGRRLPSANSSPPDKPALRCSTTSMSSVAPSRWPTPESQNLQGSLVFRHTSTFG